MTGPITNLPDAVAAQGALPMPVGSEWLAVSGPTVTRQPLATEHVGEGDE